MYLFDFGGRRGVLLAGIAFGLAALARETTLVFPLLFAASIVAGRPNASSAADGASPRRTAAAFALLGLAPAALYGGFLWSWLGAPTAGEGSVTLLPFAGLLEGPWELRRQPVVLAFVALPALLWAIAAIRGLHLRDGRLERLCLLANALLAVVLAGPAVWATYTERGTDRFRGRAQRGPVRPPSAERVGAYPPHARGRLRGVARALPGRPGLRLPGHPGLARPAAPSRWA